MKEDKIKLVIQALGSERVKLDEQLKFHTFNKVGGVAKAFYTATTQRELIQALEVIEQLKIPFFIMGSGTKVQFSNPDALIIKNRSSGIKLGSIKGKVGKGGIGVEEATIEVDSGVTIGKLNKYLDSQGLTPVNGISSIHSTIGGSIFLDPYIRELVQKVKVFDQESIEIPLLELKRNVVVLSAFLKVKARSV